MFAHFIGLFLILAATALLIVVSVGLPIWNSVYFLDANIGGQSLRMGQWGLCYAGRCTASKLGYSTDFIAPSSTIGSDFNGDISEGLADTVIEGLTYALILNPIAAGFSAVALLFALIPALPCGILASIASFWAFIVTCAAVGINFGLFTTARNRLRDQGIDADFDVAIWLVVAAAGCLLLASFTVCFTHRSRKHRRDRDSETNGLTSGQPQQRRGFFGRRKANNDIVDPYYADQTTGAPPMAQKQHFWQRR